MGIRRGSISTPIIADGLVFNMDAANRASTIPSTSTTTTFNTIDTSISGVFYNGATWEPDNKGIFHFDGIDDYIGTNDASSLFTNTFTMSFWWKLSDATSANSPYILNSPNYYVVGKNGNFSYRIDPPSQITFQSYDGRSNVQYMIHNGLSLSANIWYNTVLTSDGTTAGKHYINGILYTSGGTRHILSRNLSDISNGLYFGRFGNEEFKEGPTQIYNRALSAQEIKQNYNALKSRFE